MERIAKLAALALLGVALMACDDAETDAETDEAEAASAEGATSALGEVVDPPFEVRADLRGLMLTWFDEEGPHMANSKEDIPPARRAQVRVDSLDLPPEQRDGDHVYVADVSGSDVVVRRYTRDSFDALVDAATGHGEQATEVAHASTAGADVIVYGTSWCSACRQAERWLAQNGIPYEDKDVERDPAALQEMQRKARAAGIQPSGVPVIDARGTMMVGFDANAIQRALQRSTI